MPPVKRRRAKQGRLGFVACIAVVALLISATGAGATPITIPSPIPTPTLRSSSRRAGRRSPRSTPQSAARSRSPGAAAPTRAVLVERPGHEPRWRRSLHEPGDRRVGSFGPGSTGSFSGTFVSPTPRTRSTRRTTSTSLRCASGRCRRTPPTRRPVGTRWGLRSPSSTWAGRSSTGRVSWPTSRPSGWDRSGHCSTSTSRCSSGRSRRHPDRDDHDDEADHDHLDDEHHQGPVHHDHHEEAGHVSTRPITTQGPAAPCSSGSQSRSRSS